MLSTQTQYPQRQTPNSPEKPISDISQNSKTNPPTNPLHKLHSDKKQNNNQSHTAPQNQIHN